MLKKILIAVGVVIAAFVAVVALQPADFKVERSASMAAPPELVFPLVNDFHAWTQWSPWEKLDSNLARTYDGAPAGVGATYAWKGEKSGEGKMRILESQSPEKIAIELEFLAPMKATNRVDFTFARTAGGTDVTWVMTGKNGFIGKAFSLFVDMDPMVGKDFEDGLASMKTAAEAEAKKRADQAAAQAATEVPAEATP